MALNLKQVPILGWFYNDAVNGKSDAKYYFMFNLSVVIGVLMAYFGYPFVIALALLLAGGFLLFLVYFTSIDMIENCRQRRKF